MSVNDGDPGKGLHPLDPRAAELATHRVDPLRFCPECGNDDQVESGSGDTLTFTESGETVRAAICLRCRIMWSERSPSGKEIRADYGGGKRARSISIPGAPTRPYSDPRRDPRLVTAAHGEDPRIRTMKVQLRRDIAYYAACVQPDHTGCRCHAIEDLWQNLVAKDG